MPSCVDNDSTKLATTWELGCETACIVCICIFFFFFWKGDAWEHGGVVETVKNAALEILWFEIEG